MTPQQLLLLMGS